MFMGLQELQGSYNSTNKTFMTGLTVTGGMIFQGGFSFAPYVVTGQVAYTTPGTYSWTAPTGVTSVSVVAVGPGGDFYNEAYGGGSGGGLGYKNNISVTPGASYTVVVGANSFSMYYQSYFINNTTVMGEGGGIELTGSGYVGDGGGSGGSGGVGGSWPGGGGAGGYAGQGGQGGGWSTVVSAGSGGGGGGGIGYWPGGGGGVGLLGQGTNGAAGQGGAWDHNGGYGGSGGQDGNDYYDNSHGGGAYGGGGGRSSNYAGSCGAVRIIWPGTTRQFPSTNTGDI